jgi:hypothetical protein
MSESVVQAFDSEAGFRAGIDLTLAAACKELRVFDRDLGRMGLETPTRIAALTTFLASGHGRLKMVLHDTSLLEQRSPRLVGLIRHYGHAIEVRRTPDHLRQVSDCWVLADQSCAAIRFHIDHPRGKLLMASPVDVRPWWDRFDELWEASEACSPGATTGL